MADLNTNRSFINGDVDLEEQNTVATGHATAFGAGASGNAAAGDNGIAALGSVNQADHGALIGQDSSFGGPVATNPVNSVVAGGGVDHSNAGQGNIGINADHSGGGLSNAGLNFGSGEAHGGGNIDAHHTNVANVENSSRVNLAQDDSTAHASQDDTTAVFKDSFNTDETSIDDSFNRDDSVHQHRTDLTHLEDNSVHHNIDDLDHLG